MELKLTCKMSGFRSQKVTSGAQIVCAVKVGTLHMSRGLVLGRARRRRERYYNTPASLLTVGAAEDSMTQTFAEEIYTMDFFSEPHLPDLVSTMMALAQHLKEASTAPIATDSVGSRVRWEVRRSSSNICLWNMAASASRAI